MVRDALDPHMSAICGRPFDSSASDPQRSSGLVGERKDFGRHIDANRFGGLEVAFS
jgi:hypothetical protein